MSGPWIFEGNGTVPMMLRLRLLSACLALLLFASLALGGCGGRRPAVQEFSSIPAGREARSIAVLPFGNRSGYEQGGKIVQRLVTGELLAGDCGWRVVLEGDMVKVYRQMRLRPWEPPSIEQLRVIAARLGADLLLAGEVLEMEEKVAAGGVNPVFAVQLRVYDGASGSLLWSTLHRRQGGDYQRVMHFGVVGTISALARRTIQEMLLEWEKRGLLICPGS